MTATEIRARVAGFAILGVTLAVAAQEWRVWAPDWQALAALLALGLALFWPDLRRGGRAFILVGLGLAVAAVATGLGGWTAVALAAQKAAFITAFFIALSMLRTAADGAQGIARAGRYLAEQPPGQRYGALTLGGQLFALPLSYGAIQLLGQLAVTSAAAEPDAEIRVLRRRRMLLAIQRAFVSTLAWSPLSFAIAISTAVIPGSSWGQAVWPGLVTMICFSGLGWLVDTASKPRIRRAAAPRAPRRETARALIPLAALLAVVLATVLTLHLSFGVRIVGVVMAAVPVISILWIAAQARANPDGLGLARRADNYLTDELPGYRNELTLLAMAGFIGTVGAPLLAPLVAMTPLHPEDLPGPVVLVGLVWLIPILGQLGMNPILAVTLIAPLLPSSTELGVTPTAVVVAITAGWSLGGVTSPFTATTLLVGKFGGVSARHVGLVWNAPYVAVMLLVMPVWVLVYGYVLT